MLKFLLTASAQQQVCHPLLYGIGDKLASLSHDLKPPPDWRQLKHKTKKEQVPPPQSSSQHGDTARFTPAISPYPMYVFFIKLRLFFISFFLPLPLPQPTVPSFPPMMQFLDLRFFIYYVDFFDFPATPTPTPTREPLPNANAAAMHSLLSSPTNTVMTSAIMTSAL